MSHGFRIPVELHGGLEEILVDGREHRAGRVERCVEKHGVGLDLERTNAYNVSPGWSMTMPMTYCIVLRKNPFPGVFDISTVREFTISAVHQHYVLEHFSWE